MSTEENPNGWLQTIVEGGLPQIIAGPAGKALSRLIGAGIEIPAAWLDQKAQSVRDETAARSVVMKSLSEKSAELGFSNPALLDRGLNSLLSKAYRVQENIEAVAAKTVEFLSEGPPPIGDGPSDDWMNVFESQAARASSDELRGLYAKILAGEIRKTGSFSLSTMHLLSILDTRLAELIEAIAPYITSGKYLWTAVSDDILGFEKVRHLEDVGVMAIGAGLLQMNATLPNKKIRYNFGPEAIIATYDQESISIPSYPLSTSGTELIGILDVKPDVAKLVEYVWKTGPTEVHRLLRTMSSTGKEVIIGMVVLPRPQLDGSATTAT